MKTPSSTHLDLNGTRILQDKNGLSEKPKSGAFLKARSPSGLVSILLLVGLLSLNTMAWEAHSSRSGLMSHSQSNVSFYQSSKAIAPHMVIAILVAVSPKHDEQMNVTGRTGITLVPKL